MKKKTIGIIGMGFVGNAVSKGFGVDQYVVKSYDKYKDSDEFKDVVGCEFIFLCLPTLFSTELRGYDYKSIHEVLEQLDNENYSGTVIVKSTTQPGTVINLQHLYNLNIVHNPEFLTARTAVNDFSNQNHIILGHTDGEQQISGIKSLYTDRFPDAKITISTSTESELMKIFANSFYAVKVQFFNEMYDLCGKMEVDFNNVKDMILSNGWVNPMHTDVPGPDGKLSYGGACFPKDTQALYYSMVDHGSISEVLGATISERNKMRKDENIKRNRD
tara:strand:- start:10138 stop:10959 length:822 start_codon:yes stop_codon:yes gene_type:complete